MQFSSYPSIFSTILSNIYEKHITVDLCPDYEKVPSEKRGHSNQKRYLLRIDGVTVYSINVNPYFNCCGIHNINGLDKRFSGGDTKLKNLSTLFVLSVCCIIFIHDKPAIINLTVPSSHKTSNNPYDIDLCYRKSYKVAQNLMKIMGGTEFKFDNNNTSNIVSHISLTTNLFKPIKDISYRFAYGEMINDDEKRKNEVRYNEIFQIFKNFLDPIK